MGHQKRCTFSRSYGAMLPSSFTRVLSSAWEFSSCPPVSDYGTVCVSWSLGAFPGSVGSVTSAKWPGLAARCWPSGFAKRIHLPAFPGTTNARYTYPSPSPHRTDARCWNINQLPIDYAFLPRLRGRLTLRRWTLRKETLGFRRLTLRKETLGFRRGGFSPPLSLLMSAFALPIPPADLTIHLQRRTERSSTAHHRSDAPQASVYRLAPLNLPRRPTRPVSYYAFFKGWLLLSQPPGCLCLPTSFSTER